MIDPPVTPDDWQSLLHYGYLVRPQAGYGAVLGDLDMSALRVALRDVHDPALLAEGARRLDEAICTELTRVGDGLQIVPLSGGLDSRAILAGLRRHLDTRQILAVTVGVPGTWDFDLPALVTKAAGVHHETINLDAMSWSEPELAAYAALLDHPIPLFVCYCFGQVHLRWRGQGVFWTGFMGDPLSGSHLPPKPAVDWKAAVQRFVRREAVSLAPPLTIPGWDPASLLPEQPWVGPEVLTYDEQLDFAVRQGCFIHAMQCPSELVVAAPLLQPVWKEHMLTWPRAARLDQRAYKAILLRAYPGLFALPTKSQYGLPLSASPVRRQLRRWAFGGMRQLRRFIPQLPAPVYNYGDLRERLRAENPMHRAVSAALEAAQAGGHVDHLDIERFWRQHQAGTVDHTFALLCLASLAYWQS